MTDLKPDEITALVAKAFVLEALTDKPGCTTRYHDLPGKPLQDFVMAGINSAKYYGLLAADLTHNPKTSIFTHNLAALKASNRHKSSKYINVGLLEIMFVAVAARLNTNDPKKVVAEMFRLAKNTTNQDVKHIISTRKLAWSTSEKSHKHSHDFSDYENLQSILDYFKLRVKNHPPETTYYQWSKEYVDGFPILNQFFECYQQNGEIMNTTTKVFTDVMSSNSLLKVGNVADMCAGAIFLWLSFNDKPV